MNLFTLVKLLLATPLLMVCADRETILSPTGDLYFSENEHTLKFELNLATYYLNAQMIENNTKILDEKCIRNPNIADCKYFHGKFKEMVEYVAKETRNLHMTRNKRELLCLAIAFIATSIVTAITSFIAGAAVGLGRQKELEEQHNIMHNATINQFLHNENSLDLKNRSTNAIFSDINSFKENFTETQIINQLLATTLFGINNHNKDTVKYLDALENNLKQKLFTIIDVTTFNKTLHEMKTDV